MLNAKDDYKELLLGQESAAEVHEGRFAGKKVDQIRLPHLQLQFSFRRRSVFGLVRTKLIH